MPAIEGEYQQGQELHHQRERESSARRGADQQILRENQQKEELLQRREEELARIGVVPANIERESVIREKSVRKDWTQSLLLDSETWIFIYAL